MNKKPQKAYHRFPIRFFLLFLLVSSFGVTQLFLYTKKELEPQNEKTNKTLGNPKYGRYSSPFKNWGLSNNKNDSHIDAVDAWTLEEGSKDVIVAVIDTGVDANHKDLVNNLWQDPASPGERIYGWNFVTNKPNPVDDNGHGTHIAGMIGAKADMENGMSGVAHKVSIMAVKYYSEANTGAVNLRNTISALNYAVDHGANIINYSGGGPEFSADEYLAMKRAEAKGILVVAAAGNNHEDVDLEYNYYYPGAYRLSNILVVASTDINNNILPSSDWGVEHVDIAAPGENIYSTLPNNRFGYMTGTSMATAVVSGVAALLLSHDRTLTPQAIIKIIKDTSDKFPSLKSKIQSGGRINAYSALLGVEARQKQFRKLANSYSSFLGLGSDSSSNQKSLEERLHLMGYNQIDSDN